MKYFTRWLRFGAAAVLASAMAAAIAQPLLIDTQRSVMAQYRQDAAIQVKQTADGVAPESLAVRADTAVTDTLVVGALPSGPGYARALIYGAGISQVLVNAQVNASTVDARHELRAEVSETMRGANPSQMPQTLAFSFVLRDMFIEFWDNYGAAREPNPFTGSSDAIGAQIQYEVERDGVTRYRAMLTAWGGRDTVLTFDPVSDNLSGVDTGGAALRTMLASHLDGSAVGAIGDVPRIRQPADLVIDNLDLGLVPSLATFEVKATMSATLLLPAGALGAGGRVGIGDPNDLSGTGFGQLSLVPEPATALLMGVGVVAVACGCRRRWRGAVGAA